MRGRAEPRKEGFIIEDVEPRAAVAKALETMAAKEQEANPWICRVCGNYTASGAPDYAVHFAKAHPDELRDLISGFEDLDKLTPDTLMASVAQPPQPPKRRQVLTPSV